MVDRNLLRLSAILLFVGVLLSLFAGILHPARADANDHVAAFTEYANDASWTAVHLGQFIGMAVLIAGLLTLFAALKLEPGIPLRLLQLGAILAIVSLALY